MVAVCLYCTIHHTNADYVDPVTSFRFASWTANPFTVHFIVGVYSANLHAVNGNGAHSKHFVVNVSQFCAIHRGNAGHLLPVDPVSLCMNKPPRQTHGSKAPQHRTSVEDKMPSIALMAPEVSVNRAVYAFPKECGADDIRRVAAARKADYYGS